MVDQIPAALAVVLATVAWGAYFCQLAFEASKRREDRRG